MITGTILLRVLRRAASLEDATSVEDFVRMACLTRDGRPDLRLSVYEIEEDEALKATAEHAASYVNPEARAGLAIALEDARDRLDYERGKSQLFDFVRMRHRSILLLDEAELCELIATVFPAMERHRRFSEEDIGKYVASRLDAGDEEWATLCAKTKRKAWGELASTYRTPRRAGNHEETQVSLDSLFARAATAEEPAEARPTATTAREPEQTSDE